MKPLQNASTRFVVVFGILLTMIMGCQQDFDFEPSTGDLRFSRDTVYLDTVFTNIGSSTYTLKVYNDSNDDIIIPTVALADGQASSYRLQVDGVPGKEFENVEIFAQDSIFVFIETTFDIGTQAPDDQFLLTDQILFDTDGRQQEVELVSLIQDAVFLFPERFADGTTETLSLGMDAMGNDIAIEGFFLDDAELNFTADLPYVIYGYAAVPSNKTMTVAAGSRLHFHFNSGLIVAADASLKVNGQPSIDPDALEGEVIFQGDRLEPEFEDVPGQWGTLWLTDGSTDHEINHATIKNASVGIIMDNATSATQPTLRISNTQIYNSANFGIRARSAFIEAENLVINNSGQFSLLAQLGGTYDFTHCTLANYWNSSFRNTPSVFLSNAFVGGDTLFVQDLNASFVNCIIDGNEQRELGLEADDNAGFATTFTNSLIRFEDPFGNFDDEPLYDFAGPSYQNVIINGEPEFAAPFDNDLRIDDSSAANGAGNTAGASLVPTDLLGTTRGATPDAGAYESVVIEN